MADGTRFASPDAIDALSFPNKLEGLGLAKPCCACPRARPAAGIMAELPFGPRRAFLGRAPMTPRDQEAVG